MLIEFAMNITFFLMTQKDMTCTKLGQDTYECGNEVEICLVQDQKYYCSPEEEYYRIFEERNLP